MPATFKRYLKFRTADKPFREWQIEKIDKLFLIDQLAITINALNNPKAPPLDNFLGIIGEYAFDGLLEKLKVKYEWNKRRADYWQENAVRPDWDFKLANGLTFECGACRPYHNYAILAQTDHKLTSDYFVQVKINQLSTWGKLSLNGVESWVMFNADQRKPRIITNPEEQAKLESSEKNAFAVATIQGYDKISVIKACEGQWRYGKKGNFPTTEYAGYYEPSGALETFSDLVNLIKGKPTPDYQPQKNVEQTHF